MKKKSNFSGQIGFVLAAAGSAVGVGNLWRFPYLVARDGGGLFLIIYLVLVLTFGFTLLTTDIAIGRKTGQSAIKAYETMTGEEIDDENLDAANDELVLTGKLVEDIGDSEKAEDLMALVKQEVAENKLTSAEDIQNVVDQACEQLDIQLSEENQQQIAKLMKKIEGLDLDVDKLKDQAKDLYQKLENLDFHVDKESVGNFFTRIIDAIVKFFQGLFGK